MYFIIIISCHFYVVYTLHVDIFTLHVDSSHVIYYICHYYNLFVYTLHVENLLYMQMTVPIVCALHVCIYSTS